MGSVVTAPVQFVANTVESTISRSTEILLELPKKPIQEIIRAGDRIAPGMMDPLKIVNRETSRIVDQVNHIMYEINSIPSRIENYKIKSLRVILLSGYHRAIIKISIALILYRLCLNS